MVPPKKRRKSELSNIIKFWFGVLVFSGFLGCCVLAMRACCLDFEKKQAELEKNPIYISGVVVNSNFAHYFWEGDKYSVVVETCLGNTEKDGRKIKTYDFCGPNNQGSRITKTLVYQWPDAERVAHGGEAAMSGEKLKVKVVNPLHDIEEESLNIPNDAQIIERKKPVYVY